jgi:hypothetical protein
VGALPGHRPKRMMRSRGSRGINNHMEIAWPLGSVVAETAGTTVMTLAYAAIRRLRPRVHQPLDYDDSLVPGQIVAAGTSPT